MPYELQVHYKACYNIKQAGKFKLMEIRIKKGGVIIFLFCLLSASCKGQDSLLIDFLIKRIAAQEVSADDYFFKGIYKAYYRCFPGCSTLA